MLISEVLMLHLLPSKKTLNKASLSIASIVMLTACGGSSSSDKDIEQKQDTPQLSLTSDSISNIAGRTGANGLSILDNDTLDNAELSLDLVTISVLNSDTPLSLNEDGTINVAAMTPAGTYALEYQVCLQSDASVCATGDVSVEVMAATFALTTDASMDLNGGLENLNILDVLANDMMDEQAIMADDVSVTLVSGDDALTLVDNSISLLADTLAGDYALTYQVCENLNPENCAQSTVTAAVTKGSFMKGVHGLKYESDSATGYTDEQGGFVYNAGDNITFYLGGTQLGEQVMAKASISPEDLVSDVSLPRTAIETTKFLKNFNYGEYSLANSALINILTLLYSFDSDRDGSNNVSIKESTHQTLMASNFDLYQLNYLFSSNKLTLSLFSAFANGDIVHADTTHPMVAMDHAFMAMGLQSQVYSVSEDIYTSASDDVTYVYGVSYDKETHQLRWDYHELDVEGNEVADSQGYDLEQYDANANFLSWKGYYEGELSSQSVTTRDIHGRPVSQNYTSGSYTNDQQYMYNEQGLQSSYNRTRNGAEQPELIVEYQYDADGNLTREAQDRNNDGNPDTVYKMYYNNGTLVKKENYWDASYDENAINVVDSQVEYTYNDSGQLLQQIDSNFSANRVTIKDYVYDDAGNLIFVKTDADPLVEGYDNIESMTYDDRGNMLSKYYDHDADGVNYQGNEYKYDDNNLRIEHTSYVNGDLETPQYILYRTYNEHGFMLNYLRDNWGDGSIDDSRALTYDEHNNIIEERYYSGDLDSDPRTVIFYGYELSSFAAWQIKDYF
ncbi:hypothetical protein E2K93_15930 [Thalassotalea sp. HSM 43]|uniref:hypothetical protein n=1 Tax=Thalassotalea sp. HSM 43 TaxID=2552945 RepID=UPI001081D763|nr:hypothetical protein [Thalassotalea sp. HSM 43]QBY05758.1 hypothetical protein E2K93_15930 [Thalassotalea sp. HSM 43]